MRILYCNKYNFAFSGTEVYLFGLMELMKSRGHEAALFSMADPRGKETAYDSHFAPHIEFKREASLWKNAGAAAHAMYSRQARRGIAAMIEEFRPEVAHVRNIYHHLSPSILWELKKQNIPVVYHLNDFKLLCPSYNLVSQGKACEACKSGKFRSVLTTECYPGKGARAVLMGEAYLHKWLGTYRKCVDRFLAPSQFVRDKFVEHGWDAARFEVLPHFQAAHQIESKPAERTQLLYFGRLSPEKGVTDLLRAMQRVPHMRLTIAGDGPERENLQQLARALSLANVEFKGHLQGTELDALIVRSSFTVLPSLAYETFGKTIVESYAHGRAVIATDLGSRRELVREGETGLLYPPGDVEQLAAAIEWLGARPDVAEKMGRAGRDVVKGNHKPEAHCDALLDLYGRMIAGKLQTCDRKFGAVMKKRMRTLPPDERFSFVKAPVVRSNSASLGKTKLRVAFIGGRGVISKYSGIETYYEEVGGRLVQMGHEVTVYCRTYFTPPQTEHLGMRLVRLPTIRSKHLETFVHTAFSTIHALTQRFDIVHYHTLGPSLFSFLPRWFGKKTTVSVQGLDWQRKKWGWMAAAVLRLGEHASARWPNGTIVVSRTLQRHYREQHGVEALYVPNGGVLREPSKSKKIGAWGLEPRKYILFMGRISPEKGCHLLIEAYERLQTDVKLVIAGASSYCDEYSRVLQSHASERIKILDWVSGEMLDELLTNAMIFVLPSDLEGLSLALLDAMGAGLCVLASDVPENLEVVQGVGFTFKRGDSTDLADQLRFLLDDQAAREAAGKAAKTRVLQQYLWPEIAVEIERAYLELAGQQRSSDVQRKPNLRILEAAIDSSEESKQKAG